MVAILLRLLLGVADLSVAICLTLLLSVGSGGLVVVVVSGGHLVAVVGGRSGRGSCFNG